MACSKYCRNYTHLQSSINCDDIPDGGVNDPGDDGDDDDDVSIHPVLRVNNGYQHF